MDEGSKAPRGQELGDLGTERCGSGPGVIRKSLRAGLFCWRDGSQCRHSIYPLLRWSKNTKTDNKKSSIKDQDSIKGRPSLPGASTQEQLERPCVKEVAGIGQNTSTESRARQAIAQLEARGADVGACSNGSCTPTWARAHDSVLP